MKTIKYLSLMIVLACVFTHCGGGPDLRNTVLAAEAMERAREAQAPIYAPQEYKFAEQLFDQMNNELDKESYQDANSTALLVIDAANEAIRVARLMQDAEK